MAENAKDGATKDVAAKKGRAKKKTTVKAASEAAKSAKAEILEAEVVTETTEAAKDAADEGGESAASKTLEEQIFTEELQTSIREQIVNCKNELEITLRQSIKDEFGQGALKDVRRAERRRRVSILIHDIIIAVLIAIILYFGYCLYDVRYFDFMKSACEKDGTCQSAAIENTPVKDVLKDTNWYIENYGYLFDNLKTNLDADSVDAYYLYSGDYRLSDIKPPYLLSMAYNRVQPSFDAAQSVVTVAASDLREAFSELFGTLDYYSTENFTHGCQKFSFSRELDVFSAEYAGCTHNLNREIVEVIDEMYEEGNALYVITTATIYDKLERNFYTFDDLFRPAVINADPAKIDQYSARLNRYQYQFKKTDGDDYHFSSITKLR